MEQGTDGQVWRWTGWIEPIQAKGWLFDVWLEIVHSYEDLKNIRWKLGNSKKLNFWCDILVDEKPLLSYARAAIPEDLLRLKVVDF